jgi:acylphosphatase
MSRNDIRYVVRYTGHVQGVGFRMTAVDRARGLNVHGFVRNEHDGSVAMDVEGSRSELKELIRRIDTTMDGKIEAVEIDEGEARGLSGGFKVQY